jgi:hypothetical protein
MKIKHALTAYFTILHWNGISAADLVDQVHLHLEEVPALWELLIGKVLGRFRGPRSMRFDFSEVREPILAIDRQGNAIVGPLRAMKVRKLAPITERVLELPLPSALRSRKA